jgi:hypothetical protein
VTVFYTGRVAHRSLACGSNGERRRALDRGVYVVIDRGVGKVIAEKCPRCWRSG